MKPGDVLTRADFIAAVLAIQPGDDTRAYLEEQITGTFVRVEEPPHLDEHGALHVQVQQIDIGTVIGQTAEEIFSVPTEKLDPSVEEALRAHLTEHTNEVELVEVVPR